jgi:hypothetical protein
MTVVTNQIQPIDRDPYDRLDYPETDDNLANLIHNWAQYANRLIVVLGAGASVGARNSAKNPLPDGYHLRNQIWRHFMLAADEQDDYDYSNLGSMSLEQASAIAEAKADTRTVKSFVAQCFGTHKPLWSHAVLPYLKPKIVYTTNYDILIEQGWALQAGSLAKDASTIPTLNPVYRAGEVLSDGYLPLYKPHGTVQLANNAVGEGGLVLTQFDYLEMLSYRTPMLQQFMKDFEESCVIFIGYSIQDYDIAARLYALRNKTPGPKWYAVFPRNNADVRRMYHEKFAVLQINRTLYDLLTDLDRELDLIPSDWKAANLDALRSSGRIA